MTVKLNESKKPAKQIFTGEKKQWMKGSRAGNKDDYFLQSPAKAGLD